MFEVIWMGQALEEMDQIFLAENESIQRRFVEIVGELNRRLARSPLDEGESRGDKIRLTFPNLLAVHFTVDEANATVYVTSVKRYGK